MDAAPEPKRSCFRWVILVLCFLFLSSVHAGFVSFNCAFVALNDITTSPLYVLNMTKAERLSTEFNTYKLPLSERRFDMTPVEKGWAFAAGFSGSVFGVLFVNRVIERFGTHVTMTVFGCGSAILVALTPLTLSFWFPLFIIVRVLIGTTLSLLFAATGDIVSKWAPQRERGLWVAVLSGHVEFSPMLSMPHAGIVAHAISWPAIFYSHSTVLFIFTALFAYFFRDDAADISHISDSELLLIKEGKIKEVKGEHHVTPTCRISTTPVIIAIWVAVVGYFYNIQFIISFSPMYFNKALGYSPLHCGLINMIPLFGVLFIKFLIGHISDRISCVAEKTKMRTFNSIAYFGAGLLFVALSLRTPNGSAWDIVFVVLPILILGFHSAGYPKCAILVAKQFSSFVFSYMQVFGCLACVVGSFIVPMFTPHGTHEEWALVFWIYAAVLVVTNIVFVIFVKDKPCKWTEVPGPDKVVPSEKLERV